MVEFKRDHKGKLKIQIGKDGKEYLIPKEKDFSEVKGGLNNNVN